MKRRRPPTKMMRIRIKDLERLQEMAKKSQKKLPDFQSELIKFYNKYRKK